MNGRASVLFFFLKELHKLLSLQKRKQGREEKAWSNAGRRLVYMRRPGSHVDQKLPTIWFRTLTGFRGKKKRFTLVLSSFYCGISLQTR
jgi:hypothetical protein